MRLMLCESINGVYSVFYPKLCSCENLFDTLQVLRLACHKMDTSVLEDTVLIPTSLEDDETKPKVRGTASKIGILFNLTNTTVGTGILALPYAMKSAGLVMGIIMTLIAACTAL